MRWYSLHMQNPTETMTISLHLSEREVKDLLIAVRALAIRHEREVIKSPKFSEVEPVLQEICRAKQQGYDQLVTHVESQVAACAPVGAFNAQEVK
jgi:hypothetical protein